MCEERRWLISLAHVMDRRRARKVRRSLTSMLLMRSRREYAARRLLSEDADVVADAVVLEDEGIARHSRVLQK